ncbi:MAG: hypothetical protein ACP5TV_11530 [Anaerolineae bacterium]
MIITEHAAILVTREPLEEDLADWMKGVAGDKAQPPLTGVLICPRGCGTRIYWALSAELAAYKEDLLVFLYQQLYWTACPEHREIQPQMRPRSGGSIQAPPKPAAGTASSSRPPEYYRNRYE